MGKICSKTEARTKPFLAALGRKLALWILRAHFSLGYQINETIWGYWPQTNLHEWTISIHFLEARKIKMLAFATISKYWPVISGVWNWCMMHTPVISIFLNWIKKRVCHSEVVNKICMLTKFQINLFTFSLAA